MNNFPEPLFSGTPIASGFYPNSTTSWEDTISPAGVGQTALILGIDWTATQDEPVQCFTHLLYAGSFLFYWDSQSTGEGLGVRWSWRGALPLAQGQVIQVIGTSSSAIEWSGSWFGLLVPGPPS